MALVVAFIESSTSFKSAENIDNKFPFFSSEKNFKGSINTFWYIKSLKLLMEDWTRSDRKKVLKKVKVFFKNTISIKNPHIIISVEYLPLFMAYWARLKFTKSKSPSFDQVNIPLYELTIVWKTSIEELKIILKRGIIMANENIEKNIPRMLNPKFKKRDFLNFNVILAILNKFFIMNSTAKLTYLVN